jgi:hypothetical protein
MKISNINMDLHPIQLLFDPSCHSKYQIYLAIPYLATTFHMKTFSKVHPKF